MLTLQLSKQCLVLIAALLLSKASPFEDTDQPPPRRSEAQLIEILKTKPKAEKAIACKQLATVGTKACVPELAKLLSDEQLHSWARIALEAIPDPSADDALLVAAKSLPGELGVGAINSIGVRRSANATAFLTKALQQNDNEVAAAAAVALGRIANRSATEALGKSLSSTEGSVRSAVAEGCILCAEQLMARGKSDEAAALYESVRKADVPKQRTREAIRGEIIARGDKGIPLLVEQLTSDDKQRFALGLTVARELKGRRIADALGKSLADAPAKRAALILVAFADRGDKQMLPTVLEHAKRGDTQVRLAAIRVAGRIGDASAIPALLDAATESDSELSSAAKSALASLPGETVNAELTHRLAKAEGKSARVLIELVGQRRMNAVPELVSALKQSDRETHDAALAALGAVVGPGELNVLITELAEAKNESDAKNAEKALQTACIRMPDREATAAKLAAAIPQLSNERKAGLLRILGAMGGPKALATIADVINQNDDQLVDTGTRVLGAWMTIDAAPVLLDVSQSSSADKYRVRALRGYLRLARQLKMSDAERLAMCRKALEVAKRDEERALVLDALKRCPSTESIKLASSMISDTKMRDQAVEVAIYIGEKIKKQDPAAAKSAAEQALKAAPNGKLADRARKLATP